MSKRAITESPWFFFAGAVLLLAAAFASQLEFGGGIEERPEAGIDALLDLRARDDVNVVLIVIDMLRADRLDSYGYKRETSPNLTALASEGVRFDQVESQSSWTKASMASLWLGQYPERTGVQRYLHAIPEDARMPAEILQDAGFRTGGVWRNGWLANNFGFGQGFDLYIRPLAGPRSDVRQGNPSKLRLSGTDWDATEAALGFLGTYGDEHFFLYVHYMDVHQYNYADSSPIFGSKYSDFYDSAVHWTDRNVGFILTALRNRNLLHKTLIVVASDHGESFFEHGVEGHATTLFREVQHTPLIFSFPFKIHGGVVVEPRVANVDIWPTILDLLGLEGLRAADGRSLVPLMLAAGGGEPSEEVAELIARPLYSQLDRAWGKVDMESDVLTAMVKGPHRVVIRESDDEKEWLYDHRMDPLEKLNLAEKEPELMLELRMEIEAFLATKIDGALEPAEIELDQMRLHQLRALGYVIDKGKKDTAEAGEVEEPSAGETSP